MSDGVSWNESSTAAGCPSAVRGVPVTASWYQTTWRKVACFTSPSSVVSDGTSRARASASVRSASVARSVAR